MVVPVTKEEKNKEAVEEVKRKSKRFAETVVNKTKSRLRQKLITKKSQKVKNFWAFNYSEILTTYPSELRILNTVPSSNSKYCLLYLLIATSWVFKT
jgi:hypothetical protein